MAGHSKWANIKHRKAKADARKGKEFSRVAKEIITAVKLGGGDPKGNQRLRLALLKAKEVNMPSENIERNIKKASSQDQSEYVCVNYEFYGLGGVGIFCEAMTDNKNRLATDMRIVSNKTGASIATPGSVAFNFDRKGVIQIAKENLDEEAMFLIASEAGAADFESDEELFIITTEPQDLHMVGEQLRERGFKLVHSELEMLPKSHIECSDEDRQLNMEILDRLEDLDDVDQVYHNMQL